MTGLISFRDGLVCPCSHMHILCDEGCRKCPGVWSVLPGTDGGRGIPVSKPSASEASPEEKSPPGAREWVQRNDLASGTEVGLARIDCPDHTLCDCPSGPEVSQRRNDP